MLEITEPLNSLPRLPLHLIVLILSQPQLCSGEINQMRMPGEESRESEQKDTEELVKEPQRTKPTNNNYLI